jgi:glutathione S-transferase
MSDFQGQHVLITGASTGIGLATATLLTRRGAKVFLLARTASKLAEAVRAILAEGGTADCGVADVSDREALRAMIERAESTFGPIDGLFANAGFGGRFAPLFEKQLAFESVYVDLHKFEQHSDWFVAIDPEGQVPVLEHDGTIITHTTVINEYLEDVFPEIPLRPRDPVGAARIRYWNKFVDEHVMNYVSMHGWHRTVGIIARKIESGEFEKLMERIALPDQRKKWKTAHSGFSEADLAQATDKIIYAVDKVEKQLAKSAWLAGNDYTLADINFYSMCGMMVERMFPGLEIAKRCPRLVDWRQRVTARPAMVKALSQEDRTAPGLRTWSGHDR